MPRKPEAPRADKVLPGVWRIRLPLPWSMTPHGNSYALTSGDGIVLFDSGYGGPDGIDNLEMGLKLAGFRLRDIRQLVCTHTHADHYGCAASIVERAGCPLWLHPSWDHIRGYVSDPDGALDRRLAKARSHGVPEELVKAIEQERRGAASGVDGLVGPDIEMVEESSIATDQGIWVAHETPGHAPSHVVLHQPDSGMLISGDLIVGGVFLYFDSGHTPDPVGEFLTSLDKIDELDVGLCLSGHGRPFRDVPAKVEANRAEVTRQLALVRKALADGPATGYEIVSKVAGDAAKDAGVVGYLLELTTAMLTHLEANGEVAQIDGDVIRWESAG